MSEHIIECGVAVIGSGPSGIAAAVAASDAGASVVLCERQGCVGGMSVAGMLNVWCGKCDSDFFTKVGLASTEKRGSRSVYSPIRLERFYLDEIERSGVRLLLHCQLTGVNTAPDGVTALEAVLSCGGHTVRLKAGLYIDSTGNGDLAYLAGHEYSIGSELQPASLEFIVGGVDDTTAVYPTFGTHPDLERKMLEYVAAGLIPPPAGHVILIEGLEKGTAYVNMTNAVMSGSDPTDPLTLTDAELTTRRQIGGIVGFLRDNVPGYGDCFALRSATGVGVRESRRFIGRETLTEYDIAEGRAFEDSVASDVRCGLGGHHPSGGGASAPPRRAKPFSIPFGCVPKRGGNIWLNGRCISVTHAALAACRLMPVCFCVGENLGRRAAASRGDGRF